MSFYFVHFLSPLAIIDYIDYHLILVCTAVIDCRRVAILLIFATVYNTKWLPVFSCAEKKFSSFGKDNLANFVFKYYKLFIKNNN